MIHRKPSPKRWQTAVINQANRHRLLIKLSVEEKRWLVEHLEELDQNRYTYEA